MTERTNRRLHAYAVFTSLMTVFLLVAGALVTSTGSGLSVPDWPLSYGRFFPPMVGGIFYEHGHRLVAAAVGILTAGLAAWVWRKRRGEVVAKLGIAALGLIVLQATLGGLTVLFLLPTAISVAHAAVGQTFLCVVVTIALLTSRIWEQTPREPEDARGRALVRLSHWVTAAIYVQLLLGAVVRHTGSALAIPDFPLMFGRLWPEAWTAPIAIQLAHRLWGFVVLVSIAVLCVRVVRRHAVLGIALLILAVLQILLGASIIWTGRSVWAATAHVGVGAVTLATSWILTLLLFRRFGSMRMKTGDYAALTKPGITALVCFTTAVGFYMASGGEIRIGLFLWTLLATALTAGGANAFNEYIERDLDRLMVRTRDRPLPAGRLKPRQTLVFSSVITAAGLGLFLLEINGSAFFLAAFTVGSYLFFYTPLKRVTPLSTLAGAIPGAIPPLIGWAAASGDLSPSAWLLFAILFLWQLPHFWSIAWIYREDYARAGFPVLPALDGGSGVTSRLIVLSCVTLAALALLPAVMGMAGNYYLSGGLFLGICFLLAAVSLARHLSRIGARRVLLSSVAYLPLLFALMAADKR